MKIFLPSEYLKYHTEFDGMLAARDVLEKSLGVSLHTFYVIEFVWRKGLAFAYFLHISFV